MKIDITITNDDGQQATLSQAFDFVQPAPTIVGIAPASGGAGVTVTILGSGYRAGAQVKFGGVLAGNVQIAADGNSLTCVVPAL